MCVNKFGWNSNGCLKFNDYCKTVGNVLFYRWNKIQKTINFYTKKITDNVECNYFILVI